MRGWRLLRAGDWMLGVMMADRRMLRIACCVGAKYPFIQSLFSHVRFGSIILNSRASIMCQTHARRTAHTSTAHVSASPLQCLLPVHSILDARRLTVTQSHVRPDQPMRARQDVRGL